IVMIDRDAFDRALAAARAEGGGEVDQSPDAGNMIPSPATVESVARDYGEVAARAFDKVAPAGPAFDEQDPAIQQHYIDFALEVALSLQAPAGVVEALRIAMGALRTIQGMEPVTHEITLPVVMANHATDALNDIKALAVELPD